jgi:hypothetical protein
MFPIPDGPTIPCPETRVQAVPGPLRKRREAEGAPPSSTACAVANPHAEETKSKPWYHGVGSAVAGDREWTLCNGKRGVSRSALYTPFRVCRCCHPGGILAGQSSCFGRRSREIIRLCPCILLVWRRSKPCSSDFPNASFTTPLARGTSWRERKVGGNPGRCGRRPFQREQQLYRNTPLAAASEQWRRRKV